MTTFVDTLKINKSLQEAGFDAKKSEAIVDAITTSDEAVATKGDVALLKSELVKLELRMRLQVWGASAVIIGALSALKLL